MARSGTPVLLHYLDDGQGHGQKNARLPYTNFDKLFLEVGDWAGQPLAVPRPFAFQISFQFLAIIFFFFWGVL